MATQIERIVDGSVTTPKGFVAGATYVGLKTYGEAPLDLGLLMSEHLLPVKFVRRLSCFLSTEHPLLRLGEWSRTVVVPTLVWETKE